LDHDADEGPLQPARRGGDDVGVVVSWPRVAGEEELGVEGAGDVGDDDGDGGESAEALGVGC
jgi:hypothetical protein